MLFYIKKKIEIKLTEKSFKINKFTVFSLKLFDKELI